MRHQLNAGVTSETIRTWPFTHPFILTRRTRKEDYDGQMIFRDLVGLKLPDICLSAEKKKKPHRGNLSRLGSNPGSLRDGRACYRLLHSVDSLLNQLTLMHIKAYEPTRVPSSNIGADRRTIVVGNVWISGVFLGFSRFPFSSHQHSPVSTPSHLMPFHIISHSFHVIYG